MTTRGHGKKRRAGLRRGPEFVTLPDMPGPVFSPLSAIRIAATDSPSLREMGRIMGVSAQLVSMFEAGRTELSPENMKRYAAAVDRSVEDVKMRWLQAAYTHHAAKAKELRERLAAQDAKKRRGKRATKALK